MTKARPAHPLYGSGQTQSILERPALSSPPPPTPGVAPSLKWLSVWVLLPWPEERAPLECGYVEGQLTCTLFHVPPWPSETGKPDRKMKTRKWKPHSQAPSRRRGLLWHRCSVLWRAMLPMGGLTVYSVDECLSFPNVPAHKETQNAELYLPAAGSTGSTRGHGRGAPGRFGRTGACIPFALVGGGCAPRPDLEIVPFIYEPFLIANHPSIKLLK